MAVAVSACPSIRQTTHVAPISVLGALGRLQLSVLCLACTGAHTDAMNNLANLLRADGRLADAAELLVKAVQLAPTDVRYMLNLADTLMSLRRHADAAEYFERALALAPSVGAISAAVGRCYRHRKAHRIAPHRTAPRRINHSHACGRCTSVRVRVAVRRMRIQCDHSGPNKQRRIVSAPVPSHLACRCLRTDTHLGLPQGARRF